MESRGKKMVLLCREKEEKQNITEAETGLTDNIIVVLEDVLEAAEWIFTNENVLQPLEALQHDTTMSNTTEYETENVQNGIIVEEFYVEHESNRVGTEYNNDLVMSSSEEKENGNDFDWVDEDSYASSDSAMEDLPQQVRDVDQMSEREDNEIRDTDVPATKKRRKEDLPQQVRDGDQMSEREDNEIRDTNVPATKKRRKIKCCESWHDMKNKRLREQGKAYVGWKRNKGEKAKRGGDRKPREMGPRCTSELCKKSKRRDCNKMSEAERKLLFDMFWSKMTWDQRKVYISSLVTKAPTKRTNKTPNEISRRKASFIYSMRNKNDETLTVCKQFFLSTFGLKEWTVHHWVNPIPGEICFRMHPSSSTLRSNRKVSATPPSSAAAKTILNEFLDAMPKLPSHYCRASTSKLYIEPIYGNNISDVYKEYQRICHEKGENIRPVCRFTFDKIVNNKNISFQAPKKDRCDTCISYEVKSTDKDTYDKHIERKNRARELKAVDSTEGKSGKCTVITQDVQAVKVCPLLNASALYYKTKLSCHNFTVYNNITHQARCYWFTETDADLSANTFASCIVDYLLDVLIDNIKPVIIWSDGCGYQNKNAIMSNALLSLSVAKNVTIYQKFLEKGHTQMEADSVHATIEKRLKHKHIYLPSDYHKVTLEARSASHHGPYEVKPISFDFVKDYSQKKTLKFESIRPGKKVKDPTVNDIKMIKYTPDGNIQVKLCYDENVPFQDLPHRKNRRIVSDLKQFKQLQTAPLKIKKKKYDHLQELKKVIPKDCHAFYDSLPHD